MKPTISTPKITIHAGEYFFGNDQVHVQTFLGSCVAITLWHPKLHIGGICHYALPRQLDTADTTLNPRFAVDVMSIFEREAKAYKTELHEYQAKVFGGGNMYEKRKEFAINDIERQPVGDKNVKIAFELLMQRNIEILVAHVGEFGYRNIIFDLESGSVWVKFTPLNNRGNQNSLTGKN